MAKKKATKKKATKKVTAKKATVKKATAKKAAKVVKAAAPKAVAKAAVKEAVPVAKIVKNTDKPRTKSDILNILSESTGLSKKEIGIVFSNLGELISFDIGKKGCGSISIPGLMKIVRHKKPATKARKGVNPFTGEEMTFKAKPARNVVKVRALKALKEMVG